MTRFVAAFFVFLFFACSVWGNSIQHYEVDSKSSEWKFVAGATLGDVVGKAQAVKGWLDLDPAALQGIKGEFSIDWDQVKTGNRLRDKHMREKFVESKQFPAVTFTIRKIVSGPRRLVDDQKIDFVVAGLMELHGVKREVEIPISVVWHAVEDRLEVESTFPVALADYQIKRPRFLAMVLEETITVTTHLSLRP